MWRALFAISHADAVVSAEERSFMNRVLQEQPFNEAQRAILEQDIEQKQDVTALFARITDQHDRSQFFHYARTLVWADGDFGHQEQQILTRLQKEHFKSADFATFEDTQNFKLDEEEQPVYRAIVAEPRKGFLARLIGRFTGQGKRRWP